VLLAAALLVQLLMRPTAHEFSFTETTLTLEADGSFQVGMTCDLDALALGVSPSSDNAELVQVLRAMPPAEFQARQDKLRDLFRRRVRVRFDGEPAPFDVSFPESGAPATEAPIPTVLGVTARLTGAIPPQAKEVSFFASRAFPVIHLTIVDERRSVDARAVLPPGETSDPFPLGGPLDERGWAAVAAQYLSLGFAHIVPDGRDHVLFVLGLFLLTARLPPLLWQVTAFTIAHALTLALAVYGLIALPSRIVEPLIALSIAYVAFENLVTEELKPWRPVVVFGFGLLHGLGFAGVLNELGLPRAERLTALVSFNVGIELGQIAVIAAAFGGVGWFRRRVWYRRRIAMPVSLVIGSIGLAWAIQRALLI
jgi:hypothetical protein